MKMPKKIKKVEKRWAVVHRKHGVLLFTSKYKELPISAIFETKEKADECEVYINKNIFHMSEDVQTIPCEITYYITKK